VDSYAPFQYMLQFLLQPLLVACGSTPAGQTAPLLRKICSTLKRTADATVSLGAAGAQIFSEAAT